MKKGGIPFVILKKTKQIRILVFRFKTILTGLSLYKKNLTNLDFFLKLCRNSFEMPTFSYFFIGGGARKTKLKNKPKQHVIYFFTCEFKSFSLWSGIFRRVYLLGFISLHSHRNSATIE